MARLITVIEYICPQDEGYPDYRTLTVEIHEEDIRRTVDEYPYSERTIVRIEDCPYCGGYHDLSV
jgi:hypothetical protein